MIMILRQLFCKHYSTSGIEYENKDRITICNDCKKVLEMKIGFFEPKPTTQSIKELESRK